MGNNEKDNLIDELLRDYNEQKKAHENNFGEIEKEPAPLEALPQIEKRSAPNADEQPVSEQAKAPAPRRTEKKEKVKKEKIKKERKPIDKAKMKAAFKKICIVIVIIAVIVGLVFAGIGIFRYAQSAYLKPYKEKYPDVEFPVGFGKARFQNGFLILRHRHRGLE